MKEMHPEFGDSADMFFFGSAIDGRLRTSIFAFKLGKFSPAPLKCMPKSTSRIFKEGPLLVSPYKATNKQTRVHAVLMSTGLQWYSDSNKRRLLGEVSATPPLRVGAFLCVTHVAETESTPWKYHMKRLRE